MPRDYCLLLREYAASARSQARRVTAALCAVSLTVGFTVLEGWLPESRAQAQSGPGPNVRVSMGPLRGARVPEPPNLSEFIRDRKAAIVLGKALFWDMQLGSDGIQACASCHFNAGADSRSKNQVNPGTLHGGIAFQTGGGANYQLQPEDYPFHRLAEPDDRSSPLLSDSNAVTASQGVFLLQFLDIVPGSSEDRGRLQPDSVFSVGGTNVRRVEPRNTPTVINAVFNFRNFWDGRAQNEFNGVNPFGPRDPNAKVLKEVAPGTLADVRVSLKNSSLASQAVGPPVSDFEMSYAGRSFPKLGKKMLSLRPLAKQLVHPEDGVLGPFSRTPQPGLRVSYAELVAAAFRPEWWDSTVIIRIDPDGKRTFSNSPPSSQSTDAFTLAEYNFSLLFGLAIQMYESTLISDDTPVDRLLDGDLQALSEEQRRGLAVFVGKGKCLECHGGPELTNASVDNVERAFLIRMRMGDARLAVYDSGFYNTGVRPTLEDVGLGGSDPFGAPLSVARLVQQGHSTDPNLLPPLRANERVAVDGSFKTPGLRNVELTAPYFHNGGARTLVEVVEFYDRGGDFHEANIENLDPNIRTLRFTEGEDEALVALLKGFTDERVRLRKAPFDHPQLFVPNGHPGNERGVTSDGTGKAKDSLIEIPALASFLADR